jgi:hypothetical protein
MQVVLASYDKRVTGANLNHILHLNCNLIIYKYYVNMLIFHVFSMFIHMKFCAWGNLK